MTHIDAYLREAALIIEGLDRDAIERMIGELLKVREKHGRLFFIGVGGSAANCGHAVNDFRKLAGFEAYAPTDNVAELTARTNDEGWDTIFRDWLIGSRLGPDDAVFVLSVGGGSRERNVSANLVSALDLAVECGARRLGIVGRDGGETARRASAVVVIPTPNPKHTTPHAESFQAVVWHLIVSDPRMMRTVNKWESMTGVAAEATRHDV